MNYRYRLALLLVVTLGTCVSAQQMGLSLPEFNAQSLNHQRVAMLGLGSWAVVNIAGGAILQHRTDGTAKQFHRMNALWNTVNLAIAGFGYWSALKSDPAAWDLATSLSKHQAFQKVLLFNAGLDVGYIMGGLYLTERAKQPGANADQLKGFGNAIMLQGAFLMAFDLVNYFIAASRNGTIPLLLGTTENGLGMTLLF